jgi:hypothetical protein
MKKLIILLSLMMLSITSFSQCRICNTYEDIKKEFPGGTYGKSSKESCEVPYYDIDLTNDVRVLVRFIFNEENVCDMTAIYPTESGSTNAIAERYNKAYIIISSTKWIAYLDNSVANIELDYIKQDNPMFV